MAFALFLFINACLYLRPGEIVPELEGLPIYNYAMLACIVASLPVILNELSPRALATNPISACVLGLVVAVMFSHLARFDLWYARTQATEFSKIVLYYFILVGLLKAPGRFRWFLTWLLLCIGAMTLLAVLQYHGVVRLPNVESLERPYTDPKTGETILLMQLQGSGIFSDPNDMGLPLVTGLGLLLAQFTNTRQGLLRFLWVAPIGLFLYTIVLTHSRGAFLMVLAGLTSLFVSRYGWKKAIPLLAVVLPAMLVLFAGRQTNIEVGSGTGQARIQLWVYSLEQFQRAPLFGIGSNFVAEEIGQVTHNTFIHMFAELGLFGGTLFLGTYYLAYRELREAGRYRDWVHDPELQRLRPYMMMILVGNVMGMMSLSRGYTVTTYTIVGLAAAYRRLALPEAVVPPTRLDGRLVARLILVSLLFLVVAKVYVRIFARFGGG